MDPKNKTMLVLKPMVWGVPHFKKPLYNNIYIQYTYTLTTNYILFCRLARVALIHSQLAEFA